MSVNLLKRGLFRRRRNTYYLCDLMKLKFLEFCPL